MARAQRGQVQHQRLDRLLHLHGHARLGRQRQRIQQVGHHGRGAVEVAPGVVQTVVGLDRHAVQVLRKGRAQGGKEVEVVHVLVSKVV
ncbi:hypothetical protein FQZ97_1206140 [compost metagenome]